jgi:hypothetical protein
MNLTDLLPILLGFICNISIYYLNNSLERKMKVSESLNIIRQIDKAISSKSEGKRKEKIMRKKNPLIKQARGRIVKYNTIRLSILMSIYMLCLVVVLTYETTLPFPLYIPGITSLYDGTPMISSLIYFLLSFIASAPISLKQKM